MVVRCSIRKNGGLYTGIYEIMDKGHPEFAFSECRKKKIDAHFESAFMLGDVCQA